MKKLIITLLFCFFACVGVKIGFNFRENKAVTNRMPPDSNNASYVPLEITNLTTSTSRVINTNPIAEPLDILLDTTNGRFGVAGPNKSIVAAVDQNGKIIWSVDLAKLLKDRRIYSLSIHPSGNLWVKADYSGFIMDKQTGKLLSFALGGPDELPAKTNQ
jgi:hypothetical protein